MQLFADASPRLKDIDPSFAEDGYDSLGIEKLRTEIITSIEESSVQIQSIEQYLAAVNAHPQGERQQKRQEVLRYEPGVKLDKNFLSKRTIKESLFPFYKADYNTLDWAYTNYHSLNFFKGDGVPDDSALIFRSTKPSLETIEVIQPGYEDVVWVDDLSNEIQFTLLNRNLEPAQVSFYFTEDSLLDSTAYVTIISLNPTVLEIQVNIMPPGAFTVNIVDLLNAVNDGTFEHGIEINALDETQNIDVIELISQNPIEYSLSAGIVIYNSDLQNIYAPAEQFTFDFWIKPKTPQKFPDDSVTPGTILHMSSCYAISVATSSVVGLDGYVDYHHLILQLSSSAEISPSNIGLSSAGSVVLTPVISFAPGLYVEDFLNPALRYENNYLDYEFEVNHELLDEADIPARILALNADPDVIVIEELDSTSLSQDIYNILNTHPVLSTTYTNLDIALLNPFVAPLFDAPDYLTHQYVIPPAILDETIETRDSYVWASKPKLKDNYWNHVSIRWPGASNNGGTGSIWINGEFDTYVSSSHLSLMQSYFLEGNDPDALFVGNFYEGANDGASTIQRFFNESVSENEGLTPYTGHTEDPTEFEMRHPLWAELHDIKIYDKYKLDHEVLSMMKDGRSRIEDGLLFYLPPFFTKDSRTRQVPQTSFFSANGSTNDPFNVSLSFGVGGFENNLENFVKEFATNEYPRLFRLTSSLENGTVSDPDLTSNDIMYGDEYGKPENRKRLYSILPNDNGRFIPSFQLLNTGADGESKFVDSFGVRRMDLVSLDEMVSTDGLLKGPQTVSNLSSDGSTTLFKELEGASPEDPGVAPGSILTVLRRTGDPSSNELTIFDISNMFYGDRILPRSLTIRDADPLYLDGEFGLTVRDNGKGSLYRADAESKHAEWNNVGNVLYEEGLVVIKSPALRFFGRQGYTIEFRGERNVYVLEIAVPLEKSELNISNNPSYTDSRPTANANETAERFVYATSINLHDDNLNVIARANMSQAIVKRDNDRMVIKLRMDF